MGDRANRSPTGHQRLQTRCSEANLPVSTFGCPYAAPWNVEQCGHVTVAFDIDTLGLGAIWLGGEGFYNSTLSLVKLSHVKLE